MTPEAATIIAFVAKRTKSIAWEVIRLGARGVMLGIVYAPDEESARARW
jgi:hypothetical protein